MTPLQCCGGAETGSHEPDCPNSHGFGQSGLTATCANTDRELWREKEGDYYADSIHVTDHGGIGINAGGYVIVKRLADWHKCARVAAIAELLAADLSKLLDAVPQGMKREHPPQ